MKDQGWNVINPLEVIKCYRGTNMPVCLQVPYRVSFVPHQCPGADGGVEAGHVHVLADAWHHPHEELQLSAGGGGEEEGAKLQGLDGDALTLRLQEAYIHTHGHTVTMIEKQMSSLMQTVQKQTAVESLCGHIHPSLLHRIH